MRPTTPPPVGLVNGPGDTPHTFTFVALDAGQTLRLGEFITYRVTLDDQPREVLARIVARRPLRRYPLSFMVDPSLSPEAISATVGYRGRVREPLELTAETIGYYDPALADFINPRLPPASGQPVLAVSDEQLSHLLNHQPPEAIGAAQVGWLLSRSGQRVPVVLDVATLASTHLAIIASTGAGKSYLASVLVEELLRPNNRAAVLIVDPHGEYDTLAELPHQPALATDTYQPRVMIHRPGDIKLRTGSLSLADLRYLLPNLSERMEYVLGLAFRRARRQSYRRWGRDGDRWTLDDLRQAVRELAGSNQDNGAEADPEALGGSYRETANALLWRLNSALGHTTLFDDHNQVEVRQLVRPGQATVLQLNEVDQREQQVLVGTLLRRLFQARVQTSKGQLTDTSPQALPWPVFILIEEAHHFAPANGEAISAGILKQILAEGRKFGVGVGLVSQRPGKLDADALSQCNTQCLLRIVNPLDQQKVRESVESVGQATIAELPALTKGQAIIAGAAVTTPLLCQVRTRYTPHGAPNISAPQVWCDYFETERAGT